MFVVDCHFFFLMLLGSSGSRFLAFPGFGFFGLPFVRFLAFFRFLFFFGFLPFFSFLSFFGFLTFFRFLAFFGFLTFFSFLLCLGFFDRPGNGLRAAAPVVGNLHRL